MYINIPSQYDIVSMAKRFHIVKNVMKCICAAYVDSRKKHFEPHGKTNKMTFMPSEDSDQPGHPPSLIRVFVMRSICSLVPKSSLGARIILLVLSCPCIIFILKPLQKPLRMAL